METRLEEIVALLYIASFGLVAELLELGVEDGKKGDKGSNWIVMMVVIAMRIRASWSFKASDRGLGGNRFLKIFNSSFTCW